MQAQTIKQGILSEHFEDPWNQYSSVSSNIVYGGSLTDSLHLEKLVFFSLNERMYEGYFR